MPRFSFRYSAAVAAFALFASAAQLPGAAAQQAAPEAGGAPSAQRLGQLEEQIVDLQVAVGTLQSLAARGPVGPEAPAGPGNGGVSSDLGMRVDAIETQIRALAGQIEQLSQQIGLLQGGRGDVQPDSPQPFGTTTVTPSQGTPSQGMTPQGQFGVQPSGQFQDPQFQAPVAAFPAPQQQPARTLDPGLAMPPAGPGDGRLAALPSGDSKALYEEAYGHLMQRDYDGAEDGFRRFVAAYPNDELAGNAQYWLGETYYVRGRYKDAADAFLRSYRDYGTGSKAPDSLLKLGMSLNQLGQAKAACDTFNELAGKFPTAPDHVKQRASAERRRAGC